MNKNFVITIGREFGSGGHEIACKVAQKLGIKVYDKEFIGMIAKNSGMSEEILREIDETATNSFLYALSSGAFSGAQMLTSRSVTLPITDKAYINCSNIIKDIADKESCVIVGRCANSILKDRDNVLSVFVYADLKQRIKRISEGKGISYEEAETLIKKTDKKRANYHNYYADTRWGARTAYDLCINSKIGTETASEMIVTAVSALQK
ncbi:MAG: cytidylate kinase-like family protein [Ruminococcaceae bacterium]|nr:cytidylate kinase-like family protein [Oscillospiraceae bacterium]